MTRRAQLFSIVGTTPEEAMQAADDLLEVASAQLGDRLGVAESRLLVVVDTARLPGLSVVFEHLLASRVTVRLICVAVGPPAVPGRLVIPSVIGAGPASAVLWLGDQLGVDWALASAARTRPDGGPDGLHQLTEILSSAVVFDRVLALLSELPDRVACPGVQLVKLIDAETFAVGLATVFRQLSPRETSVTVTHEAPFAELQRQPLVRNQLSPDGALLLAQKRCTVEAEKAESGLEALSGVAVLLSRGFGTREVREQVIRAGEALDVFRERAVRLVKDGLANTDLIARQRELLRSEGLLLDNPAGRPIDAGLAHGTGAPSSPAQAGSVILETINGSLRGGDDLSRIAGRLAATERLLNPVYSDTYLEDLNRRCPPSLVGRLLDPPPFPRPQPWLPLAGLVATGLASILGIVAGIIAVFAWIALILVVFRRTSDDTSAMRWPLAANFASAIAGFLAGQSTVIALRLPGPVKLMVTALALLIAAAALAQSWRSRVGTWRRALSPRNAENAASAVTDLAVELADRILRAEFWLEALARARIALKGIHDGISQHVQGLEPPSYNDEQASQAARLAVALRPGMLDQVLAVLGAQVAGSTADGQALYEAARAGASELIRQWITQVADYGPLDPPPFAVRFYRGFSYVAVVGEEKVRAAVNSDPREVMWQLCGPGDLHVLNVDGPLPTVSFAPKDPLRFFLGEVPPDIIWTSEENYAGLLRLVPLRTVVGASANWPTAGPLRDTSGGNAAHDPTLEGQGFISGSGSLPPGMPPEFGVVAVPGPRRYLKGQCPESIPVGKPFSLLVSIVRAAASSNAELEPFDVPPAGRDVLLVLHAPGLRLLGDQRQNVHVPTEGDSRPVMFELRADAPGPRPVSITAWIGGSYLGELLVEVTAERDHRAGPHRDVLAEITTEPNEGAVSLVVRYDPAQNAYRFEFRDEDYPDEVTSNLAYEPGPLVERLVADLDDLAKNRTGYSAAQTRGYLVNAGARLWSQLVPAQLREQFWDRQHRIRQLTILADKDVVPWELLYPMDPGHDAGFLVEQFPVTRAIFRWRPPQTLKLWPTRFVLPQGSLPQACAEVEAMRRLLDPGQPTSDVISALTPLQDLIADGNFGLLHFACHNTYNPAGGSSITLDDLQFTPTLMTTASINKVLAHSAPTIFMNACRTAGLNPSYNQLDGWASKFLEAGAAAFIGSLWAVSDGAAREFAQEFYGQLQAGLSLGTAVMRARLAAASQPDDPTWLAYTVYGNPRATISRQWP